MSDLNSCTISGHLTHDAELRYTSSGLPVLGFTVASNKSVKRGDDWTDKPNFIDCTMFGKRAESLAERMVKGVFVVLTGELDYQSWERDGKKRSKVGVIVGGFKLIDGANRGAEQASYGEVAGEDIPF